MKKLVEIYRLREVELRQESKKGDLLDNTKKILGKELTFDQLKKYLNDDSQGSEFDNTSESIIDEFYELENEIEDTVGIIETGSFYVVEEDGSVVIYAEIYIIGGDIEVAMYQEDDISSGWIPLRGRHRMPTSSTTASNKAPKLWN